MDDVENPFDVADHIWVRDRTGTTEALLGEIMLLENVFFLAMVTKGSAGGLENRVFSFDFNIMRQEDYPPRAIALGQIGYVHSTYMYANLIDFKTKRPIQQVGTFTLGHALDLIHQGLRFNDCGLGTNRTLFYGNQADKPI